MKQEIVYINVYDIIPNRFQPRLKFDDNKLNELANSIKKYGIICPLILRKLDNKYEIIAGERRYKAALMVGLQTVPSIVMELTDKEGAELALIENVQREDLNSIEEAKSYDYLIKAENQSKEQISQSISKNIATIDSKLRYLELTDKVKDALLNNLISEGHAKVLLKLNDKSKQDMMLDRIINERLNVKDASNEVKNINESNQNQVIENDIINLKDLNQPDLVIERNNINNALNEINLDNENNKGEYNMNEFNNMMNNDMNNMNNGGLNQINEQPQQNRFFTALEDQQVNLNNQPVTPPSDELVIPSFNPSQFDGGSINPGPSFNMPENNMNINPQTELNNQNPFMTPPMSDQTMNTPAQEPIQPFNDEVVIPQNNIQMPMNNFNNIPQMEPQNNPFMTPEVNNPFASQPEQTNPFANQGINTNPFEQQINNNPFGMNQGVANAPVQPMEPINNIPEINPMNNPFQMETPQMPVDNNYGANFAPQVNQPNPAIDKIKILVDELRNNGFNIELSEADLMDSFQLTINIKK